MQDSRPRPALIFSDTEKKNKPQCLKITQKVSFYNIANEASIIALKKACAPRSVRSKKRALKKACASKQNIFGLEIENFQTLWKLQLIFMS